MTTVALTGATGFLGSALARALTSQGFKVIALVRPTSDRSVLEGLDVSWAEGDITEPASLKGLLDGADWLIHAAGMLGRAGVAEKNYHRVHVDGLANVLGEAGHCRRLLHISSSGVLGPIQGPPADEAAAPAPSNPYERSKAAGEALAQEHARAGLPLVIARPEFVYGPGDRHVLRLFQAVKAGRFFYIGGGRHCCHPTFIDDAVDGLLRCLRQGRPGQIYHITGPRPVTFRELGETIAGALEVAPPRWSLPRPLAWKGAAALEAAGKALGFRPPLSRTAVAFFSEDRRFSWAKAEQELVYRPAIELAEGVRRSVAWYRQQGWL
jgi:dihydroflavonol-4-reductase